MKSQNLFSGKNKDIPLSSAEWTYRVKFNLLSPVDLQIV